MTRLLIIGGSDAGISAGLRARELRPEVDVTVVLADRYPNYSICGIPYFLSKEVKNADDLAHRKFSDIENTGIRLLVDHKAMAIDPEAKTVAVTERNGESKSLGYDKLVLGTGAVSIHPDISGLDLPGVFFLRWMGDTFAVEHYLDHEQPSSATIVGGGYIGMEMAEALTRRGLAVTLVEYAKTVMPNMDGEFGEIIESELARNGVQVATGVTIKSIEQSGSLLQVKGSGGYSHASDMVLVAVGCRPMTDLAQSAGIETGIKDAFKVNRRMETNVPDIYAAGDCVETWHRALEAYTYLPLGSTSHKQGRIAGENAVGGSREFLGTLGTQSVKIFDLVAARTGLNDADASKAGILAESVDTEAWDHKVYYPRAKKMTVRVTGERQSDRLLGAQIIGHFGTEVSKRIDVFATAVFHGMTVEMLNDLDLSYTPPLSSPWDPVQMSAQRWSESQRNARFDSAKLA